MWNLWFANNIICWPESQLQDLMTSLGNFIKKCGTKINIGNNKIQMLLIQWHLSFCSLVQRHCSSALVLVQIKFPFISFGKSNNILIYVRIVHSKILDAIQKTHKNIYKANTLEWAMFRYMLNEICCVPGLKIVVWFFLNRWCMFPLGSGPVIYLYN